MGIPRYGIIWPDLPNEVWAKEVLPGKKAGHPLQQE